MTDNDKLDFVEVQARILNIIPTLSERQSRLLLDSLEKWEEPKFDEKREYFRNPSSVYIICQTKTDHIRAYAKNISPRGVFFENETSLSINEEVSMGLIVSSSATPFRTKGKIVWVNPMQLGVEFNIPIPIEALV